MHDYRQEFIRFTLDCQVLRFGEFTLKSGRRSPYFFNSGLFDTGARLARLGEFYAAAVSASGVPFDMVFGPAYKGVPLACALAIALAGRHGRDLPYSFNRKEAKDHGEGGTLVGAPMRGRVLVIDDVISDGASKREAAELIRAAGATPCGIAIALDRQELANESANLSGVQSVERELGLRVVSIATLTDLLQYLESRADASLAEHLPRVRAYRDRYGV